MWPTVASTDLNSTRCMARLTGRGREQHGLAACSPPRVCIAQRVTTHDSEISTARMYKDYPQTMPLLDRSPGGQPISAAGEMSRLRSPCLGSKDSAQ